MSTHPFPAVHAPLAGSHERPSSSGSLFVRITEPGHERTSRGTQTKTDKAMDEAAPSHIGSESVGDGAPWKSERDEWSKLYGDDASETRALLFGVVHGDLRAIDALEHRIGGVIRARARAFLARQRGHAVSAEQVDDLCQHVWVTLMRQDWAPLRAFNEHRGSTLEAYVARISDKECLRRRRDLGAQKRSLDMLPVSLDEADAPRESESPERTLAERQLLCGLFRHLETQLPERGCHVFRLLYEEELGVKAAAVKLGVNVQVIYNWQHRIREVARDYLGRAR